MNMSQPTSSRMVNVEISLLHLPNVAAGVLSLAKMIMWLGCEMEFSEGSGCAIKPHSVLKNVKEQIMGRWNYMYSNCWR